jgi:hypothetical protein
MKHKMKEGMGHKGYVQGDMAPKVENYERPMSDFAESGFSKTLEYIERQDKHQKEAAHDIKKQHYMGRYS